MVERLQTNITEKIDWNISIFDAVSFHSRTVTKKLDADQNDAFTEVETSLNMQDNQNKLMMRSKF